jgi:tetratricopeptide (TPR) repeat protein
MEKMFGRKRMETPGSLRASISIVTRGGPVISDYFQQTNPVIMKGTELPIEVTYTFQNPFVAAYSHNNQPVSIELFFGDNGWEGKDISLGEFQLAEGCLRSSEIKEIEIMLAISLDEKLTVSFMDPVLFYFKTIFFIDISSLDVPEITGDAIESTGNIAEGLGQIIFDHMSNPKPVISSERGNDLIHRLKISFEEAFLGTVRQIDAPGITTCPICSGDGVAPGKTKKQCPRCQATGWKKEEVTIEKEIWYKMTVCPTCQGSGLINPNPCKNCKSRGWIKTMRLITLQIPACIDSGSIISIINHGEPGNNGGRPGHLQIIVNITDHPFFTRTGRFISIDLPVSRSFARKGGGLRFPGIGKGAFHLKELPAKTKSGTILEIFKTETYTLSVRILTYLPALLFMSPHILDRKRAINQWMGSRDYERLENHCPDHEEVHSPVINNSELAAEGSQSLAEFYIRRANIYIERNEPVYAIRDFTKALDLDPSNAAIYDERSRVTLLSGDIEKALDDLNRAVELEPSSSEYYYHRCILNQFLKDENNALTDIKKAIELGPDNSEFYATYGDLIIHRKDYESATAAYSKALELNPIDYNNYLNRGLLYFHQNQLEESLADLNKALALDPDNTSILAARGDVYLSQLDYDNALADASKLVEQNPDNAKCYNNRAYVFFNKIDYVNALTDYNKALELDPKLVPAYTYRGRTYQMQGRYRLAIPDFEEALLLGPENAYLYLWLGQAYQEICEIHNAIPCFRKALAASNNPELTQEVSHLMKDLGYI